MIITRLIGGLGNQMFQYALGRSLAHRTGGRLLLDTSGFETYGLHEYSLKHLRVVEDVWKRKSGPRFSRLEHGRLARLLRRLVMRLPGSVANVKEKSFEFSPEVLSLSGDTYLDGYWQSEKYFTGIRDVLLKEFQPKELGAKASSYKEIILAAENPVSVHIRRGDYVSDAKTNRIYYTCDIDYYRQAAALVAGRSPRPHFFVFSDDPAWVKQNIVLGEAVTYVEGNQNFEDLHLMSLCRHNIIANSSFSWWGAWLNDHADKIVVAPKKWFASGNMDTRDLIPETWTRI